MKNIIYSKISELSDEDKFALERVVEKRFPKIERFVKGKCELKVNVKTSKKGDRRRYILNYMLSTPSKVFTVRSKDTSEAADFNITKAAHKEMNHLYNEVKHSLRSEEPGWKKYSIKRLFAKFRE